MMPHVKNVILASADQVAIDATAAKMMGFDPMEIKYIRLAHELGLGCGDLRDIEIVGDQAAAEANWGFVGPYQKMTFASRMQHKIYWGPLKKPIELSLKTVLAPWAYMASVIYHDSFWYPFLAKKQMAEVLDSVWGRLFRDWEGDIRQLFPGVVEKAHWRLRSFGPATLIETPGNVGGSLVDIQAEGVDGLYLIGERTSAAKVMGVYGSAQVALEACNLILNR